MFCLITDPQQWSQPWNKTSGTTSPNKSFDLSGFSHIFVKVTGSLLEELVNLSSWVCLGSSELVSRDHAVVQDDLSSSLCNLCYSLNDLWTPCRYRHAYTHTYDMYAHIHVHIHTYTWHACTHTHAHTNIHRPQTHTATSTSQKKQSI